MKDNIYFEKEQLSDLERYHSREPIYVPREVEKFKINKLDMLLGAVYIICCVLVGVMAYAVNVSLECLR